VRGLPGSSSHLSAPLITRPMPPPSTRRSEPAPSPPIITPSSQGRDGCVRCWPLLPDGSLSRLVGWLVGWLVRWVGWSDGGMSRSQHPPQQPGPKPHRSPHFAPPRDPSALVESNSYGFCRFSLLQPVSSSSSGGSSSSTSAPAEQQQQQQQQQSQALLAMPCDDSATVGLWELNGCSSSGSGSSGSSRGQKPVLRFQQGRPDDGAPRFGMAMALQLFTDGNGVRRF
jgi:hypothetical protein